MSHSNGFVNVLITALDDTEFRGALAQDVSAALGKRNLGEGLTERELADLGKIFGEADVAGQFNKPGDECPYRGYS